MIAGTPKKIIIYSVFMSIYLLMPMHSMAGLPLRNLQVFSQYIGVPELKSAQKLNEGEQELGLSITLNNQFSSFTRKQDPLLIDTESYVANGVWRRTWQHTEWEVNVPLLSYQGGFMDQSIISFHHVLGFPNGSRDTQPKNNTRVEYHGRDDFVLDHAAQGVGDISVQGGWQLLKNNNQQHALQISLKLPTGNENVGLGSGGTDVAVFTTHEWQQQRWSWQWQWGAVLLGQSSIWKNQLRQVAGFTSVALERHLESGSSVVVQYDAHTAYYKDTQQVALGDGHMLSLGYVRPVAQWQWHFAVSEDVLVHTAPDISFQWGVLYRGKSK